MYLERGAPGALLDLVALVALLRDPLVGLGPHRLDLGTDVDAIAAFATGLVLAPLEAAHLGLETVVCIAAVP